MINNKLTLFVSAPCTVCVCNQAVIFFLCSFFYHQAYSVTINSYQQQTKHESLKINNHHHNYLSQVSSCIVIINITEIS